MKLLFSLPFLAVLVVALGSRAGQDEVRVIAARMWHLGNDPTPEWPEAPAEPDGDRVEVTFEGRAFDGEGTLFVRQRHVDNPWHVEINGRRICTLKTGADLQEQLYVLPAGVVVDGVNTFVLTGDVPTDDITVGDIRYREASFREVFDLRRVVVSVVEEGAGPSPARVTVLDEAGELASVYYAEQLSTAVRAGVVYTMDGTAAFEVAAGSYTVHAVRGTEWSHAEAPLIVDGADHAVELSIRRELDTSGFVAADTHIHTLTHSGHGDSSVEERMVTLAGEGVELAIATDHNHNTDYRPLQVEMGLEAYFTPAVGNEVSTPIGHLNAFPLKPEDEVPPYDLHDIVKIVEGIRAKGAKAVILNHPRWPNHDTGPHGVYELNEYTGDWKDGWACPFDAMELINSQTEELEPMLLFRDWFALLNRGEKVYAVGSSDSHTVGGVVGQGRTYVASSADDPAAIDVDQAADNIANGRSSISMGIFMDVRFEGRSMMGETYVPRTALLDAATGSLPEGIELNIASPSWVTPTTLTVYANGTPVLEAPFEANAVVPLSGQLAWPSHDFWMVAVVTGEGVGGKWWPQVNDYTLAATNPVFFDVDGDGSYSHPRALAARLVDMLGTEPATLARLFEQVDSAVATQVLRLARLEYLEQAEGAAAAVGQSAAARHPALAEWLKSLESDD
jgi:hypothetical protein